MHVSLRREILGVLTALTLMAGTSTGEARRFDVQQQPILLIGASFLNGTTPFNDQLEAPIGGFAVNFGSYLSLGDALISIGKFVVNEAQAGGTTFDSQFCELEFCLPGRWQGYSKQLQKATARVAIPNPADPTQIVGYNASYVVISFANDCLHSGAFGVPQQQATPCTATEVNAYIDRVIAVAHAAQALGLTPIFPLYPPYATLDLPLLQQIAGFVFIANEQQYNHLALTWAQRLTDEVPGAILVDAYKQFEHIGDGIHPTPETSIRAALRIVLAIRRFERMD